MSNDRDQDLDPARSRRDKRSISFPGSRRRRLVIGLVLVTVVLGGLVFWVVEVLGTTTEIG